MSILGSLNIAKQALSVNQFAINVVSNNIANVNTEGYLKQTMQLSQTIGYTPVATASGLEIFSGGGVAISDISQYSNKALYSYYLGQNSVSSMQNELLANSTTIENIVSGLEDDSLSDSVSGFYSAVQQLNSNPSDSTLRLNFIHAAQAVANKFNSIATNLTNERTNLVGDITKPQTLDTSQASVLTKQINTKLDQIANINDSIVKLSTGGSEADGMVSQRDTLLAELSELVDFSQVENSNGTVNISIGGTSVIEGGQQVAQLVISAGDIDDPALIQIKSMDGTKVKNADIKDDISGGQLSAILTMGSNDPDVYSYQSVLSKLDLFANSFAEEVNAVQLYNNGSTTAGDYVAMAIGLDANNNKVLTPATEALFLPSSGTTVTASNLSFNTAVTDNPLLIAAARVQIDATGEPVEGSAVGNASNLVELAKIQGKGLGALSGATVSSALSALVSNIGVQTSNLTDKAEVQADVVSGIETKYFSEGGVNIDEELIDLVKYQRAYESAARIFSVCNEMLSTLVNLGR